MNTKKVKITEADKRLRAEIKEALGDRAGVELTYDNQKEQYFIDIQDSSLRNNAIFLRDFRSHFDLTPKWDGLTKVFVVEVASSASIGPALRAARRHSAALIRVKETWLEAIKDRLTHDVENIFIERLRGAMNYRLQHPDEIVVLPPLPEKFEHPTFVEKYAYTAPNAYSNGPILDMNEHFVVQLTGGGVLSGDKVSSSSNYYLTLHSTDKFFHTAEDWSTPTMLLLQRALGDWQSGEVKSIEYNDYKKAVVYDYQHSLHSTKARGAYKQAKLEREDSQKTLTNITPMHKPMEMGA